MRNLSLFIFLTISVLGNTQQNKFSQHDHYVKAAYQFDSLGDYKMALTCMDSAFAFYDFYPFDYFNAFTYAFKNSDYDRSTNYLVRGTKKGLDISDWYSDELNQFLELPEGRTYLFIKDSLLDIHFRSIDTISLNRILEIVALDQYERTANPDTRAMFYQDSLNFETLIELSKSRGFPTFPTTGYGCNYAFLLLWHHRGPEFPNSRQWLEILPLIQARIDEGLLEPNFLEMLVVFNKKHNF